MSYKDTFERALLKSEQLISTETRAPWDAECEFDNDLRLVFISKLAKALDRLQYMPEISGGKSYTKSSMRNFLGTVVSIRHTDDPSSNHSEIQFACPNGDKNRLFVSVYRAYSSKTQPAHRTNTYEYNITSSHRQMGAAHARLVTWLGQTMGPNIKMQEKVTKILENLEPLALSVERDVSQAPQAIKPAATCQAGVWPDVQSARDVFLILTQEPLTSDQIPPGIATRMQNGDI